MRAKSDETDTNNKRTNRQTNRDRERESDSAGERGRQTEGGRVARFACAPTKAAQSINWGRFHMLVDVVAVVALAVAFAAAVVSVAYKQIADCCCKFVYCNVAAAAAAAASVMDVPFVAY